MNAVRTRLNRLEVKDDTPYLDCRIDTEGQRIDQAEARLHNIIQRTIQLEKDCRDIETTTGNQASLINDICDRLEVQETSLTTQAGQIEVLETRNTNAMEGMPLVILGNHLGDHHQRFRYKKAHSQKGVVV